MIRKAFAMFFFIVVAISQEALADDLTAAKRADIRALMQASGGGTLSKQFGTLASRDIIQKLRGRPGFTPKIGQAVQDELISIFSEGMGPAGALGERIEDVYGKYYTHQEIKELLIFFRSPIGQKFVGASTGPSRDVISAGLTWSNSIVPTIEARLKSRLQKEGFELPVSNPNQGKASPAQVAPATKSAPAK